MSIGISLGWNCYSAVMAVEKGIRIRKSDGYRTCPFDEMLSNYPGVVNCIRNDFKDFTNPEYLELYRVSKDAPFCTNDLLIRNTVYNFIFNHESPGHAGLYLSQQWPGGIRHYIDNNYSKFRERYERRIQAFREYLTSGKHIDFVITRLHSDTKELEEVLRERYPNLSFTIHHLDLEREFAHYAHHLILMGLSPNDPELNQE